MMNADIKALYIIHVQAASCIQRSQIQNIVVF